MEDIVYGKDVVIEKTDKVVVFVIPYTGGRLKVRGTTHFRGVDGIVLVDENFTGHYPNSMEDTLEFPEYAGYSILSTNVIGSEIWITMVNLDHVQI